MFNKVASDVFDQFIWPNWHKHNKWITSPRLWHKSFIKAAKESNIISVELASQLANRPPLLRLMMNSFDQHTKFPSAQAFAIIIAFDMSQDDFDCDVNQIPELWRLRSFASSVRAQWLETIENSFLLKQKFYQIYQCYPAKIINSESDCPPELDFLLCDDNALSIAYMTEQDAYHPPEAGNSGQQDSASKHRIQESYNNKLSTTH